ncbi:MAG: FAD-dependent oxidoreductase [Treponema sp.]|nr:FAD-dependent oxidoreductase [Treponema sp.]
MFQPIAGTPQTIDVDVLVVGSGIAGSAAALTAIQTLKEQGNANPRVILIEQQEIPGGTSRFTGNMVTFPLTPADSEYWVDFLMMRAEGQADINMLRRWARVSTPAINWLMAQTGAPVNAQGPVGSMAEERFRSIPFATTVRGPAGSRYHLAGGTPGMAFLAARDAGVQILPGVQATSLRTNAGGSVTGVYARDRNINAGITFNLRPDGAVVLATGGFDNNPRLMRQHNPDSAFDVGGGVRGCGSGIEMAMEIGADTLFKGGIVGWMVFDNRPYPVPSGIHLPAFAGGNLISQCGAVWRPSGAPNQTFNAGAPLNPAGAAAYVVAVYGQENRSGFTPNRPVRQLYFDTNANEYPITVRWMLNRRWNDARRAGPVPADRNTPAYDVNFSFWRAARVDSLDAPVHTGIPAFGAVLDLSVAAAIERGWLVQSDTVAGLEQALQAAGFPWGGYYRTLQAALAETGLDPAVGNYWRLARSTTSTLLSMGGLMIDEQARVLRNGQPIPGLFAAGDAANGQFYFNTYPSSGSAVSMAATFGYIAGRAAGGGPVAVE